MNKKAFTLLEVTISITILTILMVFLYKVLDQTKISNEKLALTQNELLQENNLNKIFLEDFIESSKNLKISKDKNENSIVTFTTNNTYHNPFFNNVTYLVSEDKNLYRIESKVSFEKLKEINFEDENLYFVDILISNVDKFSANKNNNNYLLNLFFKNKFLIIKL